ncbi:hypothetical protein UFOVP462_34 [uncultured Caudovirales phage]|uniref:Uncharacterized protein n=1 Tax=uncultured Caudovirales phage TaxID=2100421 RepID=A0A6J5MBH0_9CAUD|nr:hypothetical protein UFOVP462_34 [uncultured Caudovirales phage]
MTLQEALIILARHQQWQKDNTIYFSPKELTEAIDIILAYHHVGTNEMIQDKEKIKTAKDNSKIGIIWKEYQDWLNEVPEISDEEIEKELFDLLYDFEYEEIPNSALYKFDYDGCAKALTKWYREQLKNNI